MKTLERKKIFSIGGLQDKKLTVTLAEGQQIYMCMLLKS